MTQQHHWGTRVPYQGHRSICASWSSLYQPRELLNRARARAAGSDREMSGFNHDKGPLPLFATPVQQTKDTRHTKAIICCHVAPLTTHRATVAGQGPLIMVKSGHFPFRAGGACSGPVPQLSGLVEAAPSRTDRPMTPDMAPWCTNDGAGSCTRAGVSHSSHNSL